MPFQGWSIDLDRKRDGRKVFFRYHDISFSINNMPLNEVEIFQVREAIRILTHFSGMPQFDWTNEMIPKLQQGIKPAGTSDVIMEFDSNQYLKGIENLGLLYNAVYYKKVLRIKYQPFEKDQPYDVIIHPYYLKQYNNRWFLFGYYPESGKSDWNLALDRMIEINETNEKCKENDSIDWKEYFEDIIGVTKPENAKLEKIVLHFSGKSGNYVETKPLHGSQKSKWISKNTLEVSLELIENFELERLIISYGEDVKVVSPESFMRKIAEKHNKAANQYK